MGLFNLALLLATSSIANEQAHLLYLMRSGNASKALSAYEAYTEKNGKADFQLLEELCLGLLEAGMEESSLEEQLLCLYGSQMAGVSTAISLCERGIRSHHPLTQMAAIRFLAQRAEDQASQILTGAFSSPFLQIRIEAAYWLAIRKHPKALAYIESIRQKLPSVYHAPFCELFGLEGSHQATCLLKQMMNDPILMNRIASLHAAGQFGRDDLIKEINAAATHLNPAEQEAALTALMQLRDRKAVDMARQLLQTGTDELRLAAARMISSLGEVQPGVIAQLAAEKNLYAITLLGESQVHGDLLAQLTKDSDVQVRFNAACSLLKRKDPRALAPLREIAFAQGRDFGFEPHYSPGRSLIYWKVIPSKIAYAKGRNPSILETTILIKEQLLVQAIEIPGQGLLSIAEHLFKEGPSELIPLLVELISNVQSEELLALLKSAATYSPSSFTKAFANLALYRLRETGPYKQAVVDWVRQHAKTDLIRFRPPPARSELTESRSGAVLTPEETSALLLMSYQTLAMLHESDTLPLLLEALRDGNPKNRYALAGLILQALQ